MRNIFQFGRFGRVYEREDTLKIDTQPIHAKLPLPRFVARLIADDVALVTYVSEVVYGENIERANRSSLWSRDPKGWKLGFLQGTPI
jgi:hypothetical protein